MDTPIVHILPHKTSNMLMLPIAVTDPILQTYRIAYTEDTDVCWSSSSKVNVADCVDLRYW
jgi:hypothetical protein